MAIDPPSRRDILSRAFLRMLGEHIGINDLTAIATIRIFYEGGILDEFIPLWEAIVQLYEDTIIGTAKGAALDRRLADFDLARPAAKFATGVVTVVAKQASVLVAGARLKSRDGTKTYEVQPNPAAPDGSWTLDLQADVAIRATIAGIAGNTGANTIIAFDSNPPANFDSATNASPLMNGTPIADDPTFRDFFFSFLASLKGSTRGALFAAIGNFVDPSTGKRVHSMALDEWDGLTPLREGNRNYALRVWIDEGLATGEADTATADPFLVDAVQRFVDGTGTEADPGCRDAGLPTIVMPARALGIAVDVLIDVASTVAAAIGAQGAEDAILAHLGSIPVSGRSAGGDLQGQFSLPKLNSAVLKVNGLFDATFNSPRGDIAVPPGYKIVATSVRITTRVVPA